LKYISIQEAERWRSGEKERGKRNITGFGDRNHSMNSIVFFYE